MITLAQRKNFKKIIGTKHVAKISEHLQQKGIFNTKGTPYNETFISAIFNGRVTNEIIENEIWLLVEELTIERQREDAKRESLMNALDAIEG